MIRISIQNTLLGLLFFSVACGCREEGTFPPSPSVMPEIPQDLIDAQVRHHLDDIGLTPSSDNTATAPSATRKSRPDGRTIREEIDDTLQQAETIVDPQRRELVYIDLVKRLTLLQEYEEATATVRFVRNVDDKDSLLEDIARLRMSDVLQEHAIIQRISLQNTENVQGAMAVARLIHDPLRRAKSLGNIAFLRANMNDWDGSRETVEEALKIVREWPNGDPKRKSSLLLNLTETFLLIPTTEKGDTPENHLTEARKIVLDAAMAIPKKLPKMEVNDETELSWATLRTTKNEILRTIAAMQAWQTSLEDVWETVQDIDDPLIRDEAIVNTIEMMMAMKDWEDAAGWSDEISDPELKRTIRRQIRTAMVGL